MLLFARFFPGPAQLSVACSLGTRLTVQFSRQKVVNRTRLKSTYREEVEQMALICITQVTPPTNFAPTGYAPRIRNRSQVAFCNRIADLLRSVPQTLFQHKVLEQQSYKLPLTKYLYIYTDSFSGSGSGSAPDAATGNLYFGNSTYIAM